MEKVVSAHLDISQTGHALLFQLLLRLNQAEQSKEHLVFSVSVMRYKWSG